MSALSHALAFVRHGYAVFPVNWPVAQGGRFICSCGSESRGRPCRTPAKHPHGLLCPNGVLDATTDLDLIRRWWREVPDANLGIHADGLIVVDIDPRHGGDESLRALEAEHGEMPLTWRALTGGGGEHILFKFTCPDGVEVKNVVAEQTDNPPLGPGIDIRTRGGYIVAPPSRHISGRVYAWSVDHHPQDVPLAPAPAWLIERLTARATNNNDITPPEVWQRLTKAVPEYPDMAAAQVFGHLLRHWVDPYLAVGLLHAWNKAYVDPPISDFELNRIINRIAGREDRRRDALQGGDDHA